MSSDYIGVSPAPEIVFADDWNILTAPLAVETFAFGTGPPRSDPSLSNKLALSPVDYEALIYLITLPFITETVLLGSATMLFITLSYFLLKRAKMQQFTHSSNLVIRMVVCVMYIASILHWYINLRMSRVWIGSFKRHWIVTFSTTWYDVAELSLVTINITLSDSIVLWRMWIIWEKRRWSMILSVVLISLTMAFSIANVISNTRTSPLPTLAVQVLPTFSYNIWGLVTSCSSMASNLIATGLIAYKGWSVCPLRFSSIATKVALRKHRRMIKQSLIEGSTRTIAERALSILIESGAFYCCFWIVWVTVSMYNAFCPPHTGFTNVTSMEQLESNMDTAMAQIMAIYPMLILILVALERTSCNRNFSSGSSIGVGRAQITPNQVLHITIGDTPASEGKHCEGAGARECGHTDTLSITSTVGVDDEDQR
ncbi:hypothetical protein PUNSTDRAFT_44689 [Punctularia strigosozonata HHB-11173 SS5]|uniref:uncharacterized protein n=1 Tax=Punctularia strigosozonata (strain HHB-11173) TaxID=741275 RepID=UPI0004418328|nr:uncharacterized protein PUNSTDRAFT_44689 [Punctularia strigosozonata HHB-11173 SS5]EIN09319.1 hypothetical protein PUNSTDRAFT_44689 [Punctularia strigosozonata HHB-11173 SS5]